MQLDPGLGFTEFGPLMIRQIERQSAGINNL